jgi:hypothetical protein
MLYIEGEMDAKTTLVHATEIGHQVEDAVHAAVPEARQVRWILAAIGTRVASGSVPPMIA